MRAHVSKRPGKAVLGVLGAVSVVAALVTATPADAEADHDPQALLSRSLVTSATQATARRRRARIGLPRAARDHRGREGSAAAAGPQSPDLTADGWPWRSKYIDQSWREWPPSDASDAAWDGFLWPTVEVRYNPRTGRADWVMDSLQTVINDDVDYWGVLGHWGADKKCHGDLAFVEVDGSAAWKNVASGAVGSASVRRVSNAGDQQSWLSMGAKTSVRTGKVTCAFAYTTSTPSDGTTTTTYDDTNAYKLHIPRRPDPKLRIHAPKGRLLRHGHRTKIRVKVTNTSAVPAHAAKVRVRGGRPSPKVLRLHTIRPHRSRIAHVRVTLPGKRTRVRLRAHARHSKIAKRSVLLAEPITMPRGDSLAGRYSWHFQTSTYMGWDNDGLAFVNKRWAYIGFPRHGLPRCRKQSSVRGDTGCVEYRWNRRTRKLRVGHMRGKTLPHHSLTLGGKGWSQLHVPKPHTRIKVSLLHQDYYGYYPNITTWTDYLTMDKRGRYTLSTTSISSSGLPSTGQVWASMSRKDKGHYEIGPRGRITLNPLKGRTRHATIGIGYHHGRPNPRKGGLLIGGENFYPR